MSISVGTLTVLLNRFLRPLYIIAYTPEGSTGITRLSICIGASPESLAALSKYISRVVLAR